MHKVLLQKAKDNEYLQRLFDLIVYQNPDNAWIEDTDLVRWCGKRNGPPVEAADRIDETSFVYALKSMATRALLTKWEVRDLFGALPKRDAKPLYLLAMKVDSEGRRFYRLRFPEVLIEQREFTPLQQMAEAVVREHDGFLEQQEASRWSRHQH